MASYVKGRGRESAEVRKKEVTADSIGLYSVPRLICNPLTNVSDFHKVHRNTTWVESSVFGS